MFITVIAIIAVIICVVLFNKYEKLTIEKPFSEVWSKSDKILIKELYLKCAHILDKESISMVVAYGTLLGAIRHKGIIPWDDDVDVFVPKELMTKIYGMKKEFAKNGLNMSYGDKTGRILKCSYKNRPNIKDYDWSCPFIDFFGYKVKDDKIFLDNIASKSDIEIESSDFFPLRQSTFEDFSVLVPNKPKSILDKLYSDNWEDTCVSSPYNHRLEQSISNIETKLCSELIVPEMF